MLLPWSGPAYRVTTLDYPTPKSILLGQGSFLYGGRWNAIGSFRAVYGSTEDTVAVAESRATADYANVPVPFRTPRLLVAIEFALQAVLNLCAPLTLPGSLVATRTICARKIGAKCRSREWKA